VSNKRNYDYKERWVLDSAISNKNTASWTHRNRGTITARKMVHKAVVFSKRQLREDLRREKKESEERAACGNRAKIRGGKKPARKFKIKLSGCKRKKAETAPMRQQRESKRKLETSGAYTEGGWRWVARRRHLSMKLIGDSEKETVLKKRDG